MTGPLLSIQGVEAAYGDIVALRGVDIDVNAGEIVTLIGANGAGKSTLMMTIFGSPRAQRQDTFRWSRHNGHGAPQHRPRRHRPVA